MRVAILAVPVVPSAGGGFTYTEMVVQAARTASFDVDVVFLDYDTINRSEEWRLSGNHTGPGIAQDSKFHFSNSLNYHLDMLKIDLIWVTIVLSNLDLRIPYVTTVWDLAHRYFPFFPEVSTEGWLWHEREAYYKAMLPRASFILTGSRQGAREIETCYGIPAERIRTIPMPAPRMSASRARIPDVIKRPYLFYPAQFWAHKNHVRAIKALAVLRRDFDLDLVLVGADHGNEAYVRACVAAEGLTDRVHFLGFVERDIVDALYRGAEALIYLSFFGPDNIPPLEAIECGCPVVVSDHPGHREQLEDAAVFVDPLDECAIAKAVADLLADRSAKARLSAAGRALIETRRPEDYVAAVSRIFNEFARYQACWQTRASS